MQFNSPLADGGNPLYIGGMDWTEFLTDQERARLAEIEVTRRSLTAEYRRIYDRCRKRMNAPKVQTGATAPVPEGKNNA